MQLKQDLNLLMDIGSCSSDGNLFHNAQPLYWIDRWPRVVFTEWSQAVWRVAYSYVSMNLKWNNYRKHQVMYVYGEQTCVQIPEQQSDVGLTVSKATSVHIQISNIWPPMSLNKVERRDVDVHNGVRRMQYSESVLDARNTKLGKSEVPH